MPSDWKRPGWAYACVFFAALAMAGGLLMHRLETGGDNLDFLQMAKSIQQGHPGEIIGWPRPAGYAVFVLAWLGALGMRLDGGVLFALSAGTIYALKLAGVLLFAGSALVVHAWARRLFGDRRWAFGLALLYATNQHVAAWASVIGAETLFVLLVFLGLLLWERFAAEGEAARLWAFVAVAVACMFTKYQGLVLGASFGAWVVLFRRRCGAAWAAGAVLFAFFLISVGLMVLGNPFCLTHVVASDPYASGQTITWGTRLAVAARIYSLSWPDLVAPKFLGAYGVFAQAGLGFLAWPFSLAVLGALAAGLVATLRRGVRPSHVFLGSFYALLFVWPDFLFRYLMPMLPFGIWFLMEGLLAAGRGAARRIPRLSPSLPAFAALAALLVWSGAVNAFAGAKNWRNVVRLRALPAWAPERYRISREDDFAEYIEGCQWFRGNAEPEAVVYCRKALFGELAAARSCVYYSSCGTPDELWRTLAASAGRRPTYLLRDTFGADSTYGRLREQLVAPVLRDRADELELVHRLASGVEVYRVAPR